MDSPMLHRFSVWILGLDPFWRDIIKTFLDKLLLGGVAAWIVYRFARSLEKQKGRNAAAAKRVELRDGAITSAWHALRRLEIEIVRAELDLTTGSRQLSEERAKAVDNAQLQTIEMVGVARPRIPSGLFKIFVDLHNAHRSIERA
jgi:hypothetical protein